MEDDDIVRRALAGRPRPVSAHQALQELRPSMRRAQTNRRIATFAAATIIVTGGGAAALTIAGSPNAPTLQTFPTEEIDAVVPSVSTTIVVADPSDLAEDTSSVDPSPTSSSPPPTTTESAEPVPPPPPAEPRVVQPASPRPVSPAPSPSPPAPTPEPEADSQPEPGPEPTTAATSTTITSVCGQVVVALEGGRVSIASIGALAGFEASVGADGPTSVELKFSGDAGTCEIHAELKQGALDVEVQNPVRND